jgi:hypothetical protein
MKRKSIAASSLVVLSLLLTAAGAYAQSATQADVPFAFMVSKTQVPAGTYSVTSEPDSNFIMIRNVKTEATVITLGTRQSPSTKTEKLIFRHLGNQYFLTEIWGNAGNPGMVLAAPKRNRELQVASGPSNAGDNVEIALK